jgi:hypothetical protein
MPMKMKDMNVGSIPVSFFHDIRNEHAIHLSSICSMVLMLGQ